MYILGNLLKEKEIMTLAAQSPKTITTTDIFIDTSLCLQKQAKSNYICAIACHRELARGSVEESVLFSLALLHLDGRTIWTNVSNGGGILRGVSLCKTQEDYSKQQKIHAAHFATLNQIFSHPSPR